MRRGGSHKESEDMERILGLTTIERLSISGHLHSKSGVTLYTTPLTTEVVPALKEGAQYSILIHAQSQKPYP